MRSKNSNEWLAPLTGVAFILVAIIGFAVGGEPSEAKDGAAEVVDWYADNKSSAEIGAGIAVLAALLFVFFGGYLRKVLRDAEGGDGGMLSAVMFAGTIVFATGLALDSAVLFAAAEAVDNDVDPTAVLALQAFWDNDFFPLALGLALFMLAGGISIVRNGALPKWLGWIAVVLGVLAMTPVGFFAFPVAGLWILVSSVMLTQGARA